MPEVRLKNVGKRVETVYVRGEKLDVVPNGTVVVPDKHYALNLAQFRPADQIGPDPIKAKLAERDRLQRENAELQAALAAAEAALAAAQATRQNDEPPTPEYPRHLNGGKWELSDGTITAHGISRAKAEELEAALRQPQTAGEDSGAGQE